MNWIRLVASVGILLTYGLDGRADSPPDSTKKVDANKPAFVAEIMAIKKDLQDWGRKNTESLRKQLDACKTEEEREGVRVRDKKGRRAKTAPAMEKAMAIVRPHAADLAAVETLLWIISVDGSTKIANDAVELLKQHHLTRRETIDLALFRVRIWFSWAEPLLRAELAAADLSKPDRVSVLHKLAQFKKARSEWPIRLAESSDSQLLSLEQQHGKEIVEAIRKIDIAAEEAEAIRLYTELRDKYGTETRRGSTSTYAEIASSALNEIRHLGLGTMAPDIVGEDTNGVKFKLSDYRGKVVLLSFWSTTCGPCLRMVPHEREIVDRMKGKPFVLLGVNFDADKTKLKPALEKHGISWRSFWCGDESVEAKIEMAWNIRGIPTIYVLDDKGIIRSKQPHGTGLDETLDKLVSEVLAKR